MRAVLSLVIVVLATAVVAAAESANLIKNSSFETVGHDGLPADWTAFSPDTALRPIFQCTEGFARSGKHAACIRSPGNYRFGYLYQDVPVSAGKTYEVVARYRARASIIPTVACWSTWCGASRASTTSSSPIG